MCGHQVGEQPLAARNVVAKPIDLELEDAVPARART
jgi:hypothetical protein